MGGYKPGPLLDITLRKFLSFANGAHVSPDGHRVSRPQTKCNGLVQENKSDQAGPAVFGCVP
jgi:hypothetical protein